jgi:hypothetical protein
MRGALMFLVVVVTLLLGTGLVLSYVAGPLSPAAPEALVQCYAEALGVSPRFTVVVSFEVSDPTSAAEVEVEWPYRRVYIALDTAYLNAAGEEEWVQTIVHELVHVHSWHLAALAMQQDEELGMELEEGLATDLSLLPIWRRICQTRTRRTV